MLLAERTTRTSSRANLFTGILAASVLAGMLPAGCSQPSKAATEGVEVSEEITATATVQAVDPQSRLVTLRREDGSTAIVLAGPAVRNFAQIAVGDKVKVRYIESLAAALKKPGEAGAPVSGAVAVGAAELGQKPAGVAGEQVSVTVEIQSVDTEKNIVVFTPPSGGLRAVRVRRPEGREFIKGLKPGDKVEITYTEALAISVEKE